MPAGAKIHITDAFAPDSPDAWKNDAITARNEIMKIIKDNDFIMIYQAIRISSSIKNYNEDMTFQERMRQFVKDNSRTGFEPPAIRTSFINTRIEEDAMRVFVQKIDCFAMDFKVNKIDIVTDVIDKTIEKIYGDIVQEAIKPDQPIIVKPTRSRNKTTGELSEFRGQTITFKFPEDFYAKHLEEIKQESKSNPFILATDIVANAFYSHLRKLPEGAWLNRPESIIGWELASKTFGPYENNYDTARPW